MSLHILEIDRDWIMVIKVMHTDHDDNDDIDANDKEEEKEECFMLLLILKTIIIFKLNKRFSLII